MKTYIALLRGINVGGHRKVPMANLRQLLFDAGFTDVKTYIQSGNIIFKSNEEDIIALQNQIRTIIENHFGFEVTTIVKKPSQLKQIFNNCPFDEIEKQQSYFAILSDIPSQDLVKITYQKIYENDIYHIIDDCIYLYPKLGYGKSKFNLSYFEKKLQVSATARNYKTMLKLLTMADES